MNLRRRLKAIQRARRIRAFRRGRPKLGCHRCWYDCYEVEGPICPECGSNINRGAPWHQDGRYSLRACVIAGAICLLLSVSGYVTGNILSSQRIGGHWTWVATASFLIPLVIGGSVISILVETNVRRIKYKYLRHAAADGPLMIWGAVYCTILIVSMLFTP